MSPADTGRAIWLAASLWIGGVGSVSAHSLPGSVLLLSQQGGELHVTLEVALEDLTLAFPDARPLEELPVDRSLPAELLARLDAYLAEHVALEQGGTRLPLSLAHASLGTARNDHVGAFTLLTADLTAPLARTGNPFPLTLSYDAVMHEIRSHRATVYWTPAGAPPVAIADVRYGADGHRARLVHLTLP